MQFKKRTCVKQPGTSEASPNGGTDDISFFSRSRDNYISIVEAEKQERLKKEKEKEERKLRSPLDNTNNSFQPKKRKSSEELSADEDSEADETHTNNRRATTRRRQVSLGVFCCAVFNPSNFLHSRYQGVRMNLDDSDEDYPTPPTGTRNGKSTQPRSDLEPELTPPPVLFVEPARPQRSHLPVLPTPARSLHGHDTESVPDTSSLVRSGDDSDVVIIDGNPHEEQNPAFAELERKARERARRHKTKSVTDAISTTAEDDFGPIVTILITSSISGTSPLICKRRIDQRLKEVRLIWCTRQGFDEEMTNDVFLTWKGNKIFDVNTCKGMGIIVDDHGNLRDHGEGTRNSHIHFEAMTAEIFAEKERAREAEYRIEGQKEEELLQAPDKGVTLRLILKSKGYNDFKIKVRPVSLPKSLLAARMTY